MSPGFPNNFVSNLCYRIGSDDIWEQFLSYLRHRIYYNRSKGGLTSVGRKKIRLIYRLYKETSTLSPETVKLNPTKLSRTVHFLLFNLTTYWCIFTLFYMICNVTNNVQFSVLCRRRANQNLHLFFTLINNYNVFLQGYVVTCSWH